ncbi:hypothetical protein AC1031_003071 [Aphanomyces cochlioides]|nr:hypothetical protein AC1031_003071 [Aphanomyces cochlioides]
MTQPSNMFWPPRQDKTKGNGMASEDKQRSTYSRPPFINTASAPERSTKSHQTATISTESNTREINPSSTWKCSKCATQITSAVVSCPQCNEFKRGALSSYKTEWRRELTTETRNKFTCELFNQLTRVSSNHERMWWCAKKYEDLLWSRSTSMENYMATIETKIAQLKSQEGDRIAFEYAMLEDVMAHLERTNPDIILPPRDVLMELPTATMVHLPHEATVVETKSSREEASRVIKVGCDGQFYRVRVNSEALFTLEELHGLFETKFSALVRGSYVVLYEDNDKDHVVVKTQADFDEATWYFDNVAKAPYRFFVKREAAVHGSSTAKLHDMQEMMNTLKSLQTMVLQATQDQDEVDEESVHEAANASEHEWEAVGSETKTSLEDESTSIEGARSDDSYEVLNE